MGALLATPVTVALSLLSTRPSDIHGNEIVYNLAKEGSSHPIPSSSEITFLELFSRKKAKNKSEWLVPPSHHWYKGRKPGLTYPYHATGSPVPVFHLGQQDLPSLP
ncbi:hypothetical protein AVEN_69635-1 [Araneus ventricosus]|uniref:Uncharacterized protein n=1 Tax=Araneus ventricosus TaxID=182803 RepID=A0A4Y2ETZ4_ARAVE|nr:hypothetical protein AVEN_69635-1 [Araneus ventricosus]